MYCALSGNIPKEPVVSVKSGYLFERALIEKQLAVNGSKCPETGEPLSTSDLLPLKTGEYITPLAPEKSSMPHVLDHVRAEWDRLTLELHTAQKLLHQTRQELATALYRCDASARVIAKLEKERDELKASRRAANGDTGPTKNQANGAEKAEESEAQANDTEESKEAPKEKKAQPDEQLSNDRREDSFITLPDGIITQAQKLAVELQETRKSRKNSAPKRSFVSSFAEIGRTAIDGTDVELSAVCTNWGKTVVGCSNGKLHLVEQDMKVSHSEEAHSDGVSATCWDERLFTGGRDGVIKVWDDDLKCKAIFDGKGAVQDIERHPLKHLTFCSRGDGFEWRNIEVDGVVVGSGKVDHVCGAVHPDGLLFATGGKEGLRMWDFASLKQVAELKAEDVRMVAMSEKGYYMVSVAADEVLVWDLRKQAVVGNVEMAGACGMALDEFGEYGCVAGAGGVSVFGAKKKAKVVASCEAKGGSDARLGVAWGAQSSFVVVGGVDGVLRKYGAAET
ncbi:Pre-mRNA-processing factor 19 [Gracilaria domingensis]|nr:Pre-mRNA-processing factor 19 [Gracilaria domingensis]